VSAAEVNRAVIGQVTPGLVMRLEIDGQTVRMHDPELVLIPRRSSTRSAGNETVLVTGWRGREQVSSVTVSDQRINVQENVGIVIQEQRSLVVALPAPRRLDRVEVSLPGATAPQAFSVGEVFERVCAQNPSADLCR
jgi:hypothetical protein